MSILIFLVLVHITYIQLHTHRYAYKTRTIVIHRIVITKMVLYCCHCYYIITIISIPTLMIKVIAGAIIYTCSLVLLPSFAHEPHILYCAVLYYVTSCPIMFQYSLSHSFIPCHITPNRQMPLGYVLLQ